MAEDPKKGKPGRPSSTIGPSAIDEWDANLSLPEPTGKVPKFDASELAEAAEEAVLEAQPIAERPSRPSDDVTPIPDSLDVRDARDSKKSSSRPNHAAAVPGAAAPTPVPAIEPRAFEPSPPLPLEAPPLYPEPIGSADDDPLMNLFEGDMELPEEAGQALGSLLGAQEGKTMIASAAAASRPRSSVPDDEPGPRSPKPRKYACRTSAARRGSPPSTSSTSCWPTRRSVGDGDDEAHPAPSPVQPHAGDRRFGLSWSRSTPSCPSAVGGLRRRSRRAWRSAVPSSNELLADDADLESDAARRRRRRRRRGRRRLLPEPGSKLPSGRFNKPSERLAAIPSPSTPPQPKKPAPVPQPPQRPLAHRRSTQQEMDANGDPEVEMAVSPRLRCAVRRRLLRRHRGRARG